MTSLGGLAIILAADPSKGTTPPMIARSARARRARAGPRSTSQMGGTMHGSHSPRVMLASYARWQEQGAKAVTQPDATQPQPAPRLAALNSAS
jgi:hypothetical protein